MMKTLADRLAISPLAWSNDDDTSLGAEYSIEQTLTEISAAGYRGCEVNHKFPRESEILKPLLQSHNLQLASAWFSTYFTETGRTQSTIERFMPHIQWLHDLGCKVAVICECGHSIQQTDQAILKGKPVFDTQQWHDLFVGLKEIAGIAEEKGIRLVYHPHMGTGVQTEEEIDTLMQACDAQWLSLLLDTGHLVFSGTPPTNIIESHGDRILHVHLKDIRAAVLARVERENLSFMDAVRAGIFTVPGDGCIDFYSVFDGLAKHNYTGWWLIEAEQDPAIAHPPTYAKMGYSFVYNALVRNKS